MSNERALETNADASSGRLLDLRMLAIEAWRWKWILFIAIIIGGIIGIKNARDFVPTYKAKMVVIPVDVAGSNFSSRAGAGGILGVARSIGFSAGSASTRSVDLFRVMIGSTLLAEEIQKKYRLLQKVYGDSWNAEDESWIKPKIDENSFKQRLRRFFHLNPWHEPDTEGLANYLSNMVKVEPIQETSFFRITVEHSDREFALYLLDITYREADALIGFRRRQEQEERRRYLERSIETARLAEVRDALLGLLMQQEQRAVIVDSKPPYVVKVISPLRASALPNEPPLRRIIAIPIAVSVALALVVVTVVISFRSE